ncbi:MAG: TonB-dependent receptor [Caulobacteraceae bacterium]
MSRVWIAGRAPRRTWPAMLLASTVLGGATPSLAAAAAAADTPSATSLSEVIVTAQKREENLQNVPISVQALGAQKLEQLHVTNFNDYIKFLPSVTYQSTGPGMSNVYMRGVAADNQSNHSGSLPTVGTYLDEQPITTIGGALDVHVYDIARVESLSGPQGTLYGASSEAGTIRIITNPPSTAGFSAGYDATVNQVSHGGTGYEFEGFANLPLSDKVALRLVGFGEHDAGYIDNVLGTRQFSTVFGTTIFAPGNPHNMGSIVNNAGFVKNDYNPNDVYGGRVALKADLSTNWTATASVIAQDQRNTGIFGFDPSVGDLEVTHFRPETQHDRWYQAALTVHGKIANFDVVYSGGHMDRRIDTISDYTDYSYFYDQAPRYYAKYFTDDAGNFIDPTQVIIGHDRFLKDSHELRVSSPQDERFRIVGGLFYQKQQHHIIQDYFVQNLATVGSVTGYPGTLWLTDQERVDRDYAAFTEASFDITPKLTATGGIRFYRFDNSLIGFYGFGLNNFYGSHTGEKSCFAPAVGNLGPCTDLDKEVIGTGETHKLNLTYHIDSDKLIYITYSTGFRPGGVNRNGGPGVAPYQPDYLSNYEFGWKTSFLDNSLRFNGAVYLEDWQNFQFAFLGLNSLTVVENAGNARIYGVESDVTWRPVKGLTFSGSAAYDHAKLQQDFCGLPPGQSCAGMLIQAPAGSDLPVTPRFKANLTARYEFEMGSMNAHLQGSVVGQTGSWSDLLTQACIPGTNPCVVSPVRGLLGRQAGYTTADFSAGVGRDNWSLELSLINAFDTRAQLYRYAECTIQLCGHEPYIVPSRPRTIALRFGQKF